MARDRPSPYGEGGVFFVARGPVPRDPSNEEETYFPQREAWRGTGPRPTMKRRRFFIAILQMKKNGKN